ncbi:MAG: META domain-containing protein [Gammaproteobacteria bacterium]|nr:META domain-containing protein [Gammaproteobacteria bacterium]
MIRKRHFTGWLLLVLAACSVTGEAPEMTSPVNGLQNPDPAHNSRNSLDWPGVYTGTLPCADCPGIDISITLLEDGTFWRSVMYQDRDERPQHDQGEFEWDETGGIITLMVAGKPQQRYRVGENVLLHLDQNGDVITDDLAANYRLTMMPGDPDLQDREWVLIELLGKPVASERPPTLRFDGATGRLSGSDGCNRLMGHYRLGRMHRLHIGDNLAATMMACPDMETPRQFTAALQQVDNYSIAGGELSLHRARMAPLLRFRLTMSEE